MAKEKSTKAAKPAAVKSVDKPAVAKEENKAVVKPAVEEPKAPVASAPKVEETKAPAPEKAKTPAKAEKPEDANGEEKPSIPEISKDFESMLADIKAGKEVTLEGEKDVYFRYEENRLRKFSKNGGYMDAYPLYAFQNRKGWALKK